MGFSIAGIAVNGHFSKNVDSLFNLLSITNFSIESESTFDEVNLDFAEKGTLSVAFFENGVYTSSDFDLLTNENLLAKASTGRKIIAFYINENSDTYCFDFFSDGKYVRRKWISSVDKGIDSSENFGPLLSSEVNSNNNLEIILDIISNVIGVPFYEIDENYPMTQYKIKAIVEAPKISFWKRLFK